ncbi:hypothetical protein J2T13_000649 [Paenibacillus sp. DS2015]|uniref:hypothetical protein n=1 Tax=Paenibacillus sp. DS2015 TaxID=3373917 RepID=UPI003D1B0708
MDIDFLSGFQRVIRLKDLEAWDIKFNDKDCRIILVDEQRPSTDDDFPWLEEGIGEDRRENHITAYVYSSYHLEEIDEKIFYQVAERLADHVALAHCNVTVLFKNGDDYDTALNELLRIKGYQEYNSTPLRNFFGLSQD